MTSPASSPMPCSQVRQPAVSPSCRRVRFGNNKGNTNITGFAYGPDHLIVNGKG